MSEHGSGAGLVPRGWGRARWRAMVALLAGALVVPAAVVTVASAEPSPPTDSAPAAETVDPAIPEGLWDVAPPEGTTDDYFVLEGAEGDPVSQGRDMIVLGRQFGAGYTPITGSSEKQLGILVGTPDPDDQSGVSIVLEGPGGTTIDGPGFHTDLSPVPTDGTKTYLDVVFFSPSGNTCRNGSITGWVAVDHIRVIDGMIGELDLRVEQSCDGAPALHAKVHIDAIDESIYGPDPVPPGLWDVAAPVGSEGQNYLVVEGADDDPHTKGEDDVYVGDAFVLGEFDPGELGVIVRMGENEGWVGAWRNYRARGFPEVGHYPVHFRRGDASTDWPAFVFLKDLQVPCMTVDGWFAIDRIERIGDAIVGLDLRLEQSCDGHSPIHAKIHVDREPPPSSTTSTSSTTTSTTSTSTTSTTMPTTTTTAPPPVLSRPPGPPFGSFDLAAAVPGGVKVGGWAIDPDTAGSIPVHVYMDGKGTALTADGPRPDVGAAFSGYGDAHGFSATIPATPGSHQVCAYGINVGVGGNVLLGCRTVTVMSGSPFGSLDVARQGPSSVVVGGWALDPDTAGSIPVHVYVDGKGTALTANGSRPDVGSLYPGYGSAHGFSATIAATPGTHQVCAYGINSGAGGNTLLGCSTVTVPTGSPIGTIDVARGGPGWVSVGGWALDADTGDPIQVHAYVDTRGTAITANGARSDVGAYFFGWGDAHGYATTIAATPGVHDVCVYGINVGPGGNTLLGCRTVTVS